MDQNLAIVIVFGLAIVGAAVVSAANTITQFMDRKIKMLELQSNRQSGSVDGMRGEIDTLKQEMMQLRDTTTKFDLSVDNTLDEAQRRLSQLETKSRAEYKPLPTNQELGSETVFLDQRSS